MTPPSVRLIISFFLVFTVWQQDRLLDNLHRHFPFIIVIQFPQCIPITLPPFIKNIEPYSWTPPTFSFCGCFLAYTLSLGHFFFLISEL
ncbi:hypothetical protein PPACK8108_LOCUS16545 [Phakopsora pachyrhizi]|uniref:Uncharacterized protein n=1 Tax=Phakopsora pachyrhizi TaxID=170000 RepID=A0AAV0BD72_PHAPC|nr:hypothetical protein PPACK8108_LOCUS16545 [Phakopsora pachyrhizi]